MILILYKKHLTIRQNLDQIILPCGCFLIWNALETSIELCEEHCYEYEMWNGSTEEFIKKTITPKRSRIQG